MKLFEKLSTNETYWMGLAHDCKNNMTFIN